MTGVQETAPPTVGDENLANQPSTSSYRQDDLAIVSQWVRQELFKKVKFVYDAEKDLKSNGLLYKQFKKYCASRLIGIKVNTDMSQNFKDLYLQSIWADATQKKSNLVMDGLNARRSCIYSSMQNRFTGKMLDQPAHATSMHISV